MVCVCSADECQILISYCRPYFGFIIRRSLGSLPAKCSILCAILLLVIYVSVEITCTMFCHSSIVTPSVLLKCFLFFPGEDSRPEQGDVGHCLPDVHGQVWGWGFPDCTWDIRGSPESHHCPFDCWGGALIKMNKLSNKIQHQLNQWLSADVCSDCNESISLYRRSTRTVRSSQSRSSRWPLLTWSTWGLVSSATHSRMFMTIRYYIAVQVHNLPLLLVIGAAGCCNLLCVCIFCIWKLLSLISSVMLCKVKHFSDRYWLVQRLDRPPKASVH